MSGPDGCRMRRSLLGSEGLMVSVEATPRERMDGVRVTRSGTSRTNQASATVAAAAASTRSPATGKGTNNAVNAVNARIAAARGVGLKLRPVSARDLHRRQDRSHCVVGGVPVELGFGPDQDAVS